MSAQSKFLSHNLIYFMGGNIVNVINYTFHIVTGRLFTPLDYGILSSLLALFFILSVPSMTFQTMVTRKTSDQSRAYHRDWISFVQREMLYFGIALMVIILLLSPLISNFLHLEDIRLLWLLAISLGGTFWLSAMRGWLQGQKKFYALSANMILESALKIIFFGIFFSYGYHLLGTMWALILSLVFALFLINPPKVSLNKAENKNYRKSFWHESQHIFWSLGFITLFYNIDLVLVRHYLPEDTGIYSVISKFGQLLFFATHLIISVFFTYASQHPKLNLRIFQQTVLCILLGGITLTTIYYYWGGKIVQFFFGAAYASAGEYLWIYTLGMMGLSFVSLMIHTALAQQSYKFIKPLGVGLIGFIFVLIFSAENLSNLISYIMFYLTGMSCVLSGYILRSIDFER